MTKQSFLASNNKIYCFTDITGKQQIHVDYLQMNFTIRNFFTNELGSKRIDATKQSTTDCKS